MVSIIYALIASRVDYVRLPVKAVWEHHLVQVRANRILSQIGGNASCQHQKNFAGYQACVCAQFKVLVLTYKALNSLRIEYLKHQLCLFELWL